MLYKISHCLTSNIDHKSLSQCTQTWNLFRFPNPHQAVWPVLGPESPVYREINTSDKSEFTVLQSSALFYLANFQHALYCVQRSFWREWKNSSHNYFWNTKFSFLAGISDSLHRKPRWALFWLKLTFPWFQGRQNWLLLHSEKSSFSRLDTPVSVNCVSVYLKY